MNDWKTTLSAHEGIMTIMDLINNGQFLYCAGCKQQTNVMARGENKVLCHGCVHAYKKLGRCKGCDDYCSVDRYYEKYGLCQDCIADIRADKLEGESNDE